MGWPATETKRKNKSMCELEGVELDEAVARVLGVEPGAAYSTDWSHGGPLIERFSIHLAGPESRVHRNGGPNSGWGQSGLWTCTSWKLRKADGHRALGYHETSPLIAAMRMVAECSLTPNDVLGAVPQEPTFERT